MLRVILSKPASVAGIHNPNKYPMTKKMIKVMMQVKILGSIPVLKC
jgi:hypothetical protein